MTGFGRAQSRSAGIQLSVEIKAFNARQSDVRIKLPGVFRDLEPGFRQNLLDKALRGRIEMTIERRDEQGAELGQGINESAYERFKLQLSELCPELSQDPVALAQTILRLPNVVGLGEAEAEEEEIQALQITFQQALNEFILFRRNEGKALAEDLKNRVRFIQETLPGIEQFEGPRQEKMRLRLRRLVEDHAKGNAIDQNRLEQEVLFYLEKIDISEEKTRLLQHCRFFLENLQDQETETGRRLSFIAQEMGREINTLGAKAYDSQIQHLVVQMKDELEKIKEQLANVL